MQYREAGTFTTTAGKPLKQEFSKVASKHITEVLANINVNPLLINKMRQIEPQNLS